MNLVLNEEETMIKDAANDFLVENAGPDHLRNLRDDPDSKGFSVGLWGQMIDLGWPSLLVPEEFGGLDFSHVGMGQIMQQVGCHLATSPLLITGILGVTLLKSSSSNHWKAKILPLIAEGKTKMAIAIDETSRHDPQVIQTKLTPKSGEYVLNGTKLNVVDGQVADSFIVIAKIPSEKPKEPDDICFVIVDSNQKGISVKNNLLIDSRKTSSLIFSDVKVTDKQILKFNESSESILQKLLSTANIYLSAELLGIAEKAFELTMQYLKTRSQFGVKIGSFQALQHRAANLWAEIELGKSIVLKALRSLDEIDKDINKIASMAKAKTSKIAENATNEGIQMHGGIGMTDEFYIGFYLKRAKVSQMLFGDWKYHLDRAAYLSGY